MVARRGIYLHAAPDRNAASERGDGSLEDLAMILRSAIRPT
jgi:hypothetical protein